MSEHERTNAVADISPLQPIESVNIGMTLPGAALVHAACAWQCSRNREELETGRLVGA